MRTEQISAEVVKLTEMETQVMTLLKDEGMWYNWGSEPTFSDVFFKDLQEASKISGSRLRGVLSSLVKKNLINVQDIGDHPFYAYPHIIYPVFNTYVVYDEVCPFVIEAFCWGEPNDEVKAWMKSKGLSEISVEKTPELYPEWYLEREGVVE